MKHIVNVIPNKEQFNELVDLVNRQQKEIDIHYFVFILPILLGLIFILSRIQK